MVRRKGVVNEFTEHYHLERNHQGLNNRLIDDNRVKSTLNVTIGCHERLGGILKYYHRLAA
ncbi:MAG: putative transposase [Gammaproteobacteria bacterium]|jgi:putative transposase